MKEPAPFCRLVFLRVVFRCPHQLHMPQDHAFGSSETRISATELESKGKLCGQVTNKYQNFQRSSRAGKMF